MNTEIVPTPFIPYSFSSGPPHDFNNNNNFISVRIPAWVHGIAYIIYVINL